MVMSTFVLVHGGGHGAWCWYKMVPLLESAGFRVVTVDLPGHGLDRSPLTGLTQHDYAAAVVSVLDALDEPAVVVAHSMGGMAASLAAEQRPERMSGLVFLAAIALDGGRSMLSDPVLAEHFGGKPAARSEIDEASQTMVIPPDALADFFYNDCSAADIALACRLVIAEPLGAASTPIRLTPERFGRVRRFGIVTERDNLATPELLRGMYRQIGVEETLTLDTGHSPFLSAPDALLRQLTHIAHRIEPPDS